MLLPLSSFYSGLSITSQKSPPSNAFTSGLIPFRSLYRLPKFTSRDLSKQCLYLWPHSIPVSLSPRRQPCEQRPAVGLTRTTITMKKNAKAVTEPTQQSHLLLCCHPFPKLPNFTFHTNRSFLKSPTGNGPREYWSHFGPHCIVSSPLLN